MAPAPTGTGSYSQFGEDRDVLARLGTNGLLVDVEANHPFKGSNTYLLYLAGWRGLTIEPLRSLHRHHRRIRPEDTALNAAAGRHSGRADFHELSPAGFSTFDTAAASALVEQRCAIPIGTYPVRIVRLADEWSRRTAIIGPTSWRSTPRASMRRC